MRTVKDGLPATMEGWKNLNRLDGRAQREVQQAALQERRPTSSEETFDSARLIHTAWAVRLSGGDPFKPLRRSAPGVVGFGYSAVIRQPDHVAASGVERHLHLSLPA